MESNITEKSFLGVHNHPVLNSVAEKLETAISSRYYESLRYRVINKYNLTDSEFASLWLELKRFLFIRAFVPEISMFSEVVDNLWHEMILFTRDYDEFCHSFIGEIIHHDPHITAKQEMNARGWFDWLYLQFFEISAESWSIWNGFLLNKLEVAVVGRNQGEMIKELFNENLINNYPESSNFLNSLVEKLNS